MIEIRYDEIDQCAPQQKIGRQTIQLEKNKCSGNIPATEQIDFHERYSSAIDGGWVEGITVKWYSRWIR